MTALTNRESSAPEAHIAVLVCIYHPDEAYLRQQLDSILNQTHRNLSIWVSDDGDDPQAREVLSAYQAGLSADRFTVVEGPKKGFAANFLSLANRPQIKADFYAFSDQDDIWEPQKLERALDNLSGVATRVPALYGSRTRLVDETDREIGLSSLYRKPPSFANALVQSLAGGNTMLFNEAARRLLQEAGIPEVASHDWWLYLLVSGSGGAVVYDSTPWIRYRQHEQNLIGSSASVLALLSRLRWLLKNRFRDWNAMNVAALHGMRHRLTDENRSLLDMFARARESNFVKRIRLLRECGVYRQTLVGTCAIWLAAVTGKI